MTKITRLSFLYLYSTQNVYTQNLETIRTMQLLLFSVLTLTALSTCLHHHKLSYWGFAMVLLGGIASYCYYATDTLPIQLATVFLQIIG